MPGRPPKPIQSHALEKPKLYGQLADRLETEPQSELEPRCPARFRPDEKKAWRQLKAIMREYGIFKIANGPLVEMASKYLAASERLSAEVGDIVMDVTVEKFDIEGNLKSRRVVQEVDKRWTEKLKADSMAIGILKEIGLSTSALAKIGSLSLRKKKEKEEFFED